MLQCWTERRCTWASWIWYLFRYEGVISDHCYLLRQGSVLAPVLFNLYSNDLPVTCGRKFIYADDNVSPFKANTSANWMQSLVRYGADVTLLSTVATSRKPLWLDLQPVDIISWWSHNWKSAQVVNSQLVCDPTFWQPCFDLPRQQWSLLNRFRNGTGTLQCLQKEMVTYRHWSVSLWQEPDDVPHCRILSPDKTEWQFISATLWGWIRCFVVDQLCLMTRIREEEDLWLTRCCMTAQIL